MFVIKWKVINDIFIGGFLELFLEFLYLGFLSGGVVREFVSFINGGAGGVIC